jgi:hypothetical protein
MRVAKTIEVDAQTERELRVLSQRKRIEVRLQQRARIVLLAAKGVQNRTSPSRSAWIDAKWRCGASGSWTAASTRCARMLLARGARRA